MQKINFNPQPHTILKNFKKKSVDLNVKLKTIKFLEEEKFFSTLGLSQDFLDATPNAQSIIEQINQL